MKQGQLSTPRYQTIKAARHSNQVLIDKKFGFLTLQGLIIFNFASILFFIFDKIFFLVVLSLTMRCAKFISNLSNTKFKFSTKRSQIQVLQIHCCCLQVLSGKKALYYSVFDLVHLTYMCVDIDFRFFSD